MPAAVLLRHKPALQLVGQSRHHRGQGGQLVVQQGTQSLQFMGVAQIGGVHHLVKGCGEDPVGVNAPTVVGRLLTVGQGALIDVRPVFRGLAVGIAGRAVGPGLTLIALRRVISGAIHGLAFAAAGIVFLVLIIGGVGRLGIGLVLPLFIRGVIAAPVTGIEIQRPQHVLQPACEGDLVVGHLGQGIEFGPGLVLHGGADQVQHGGGSVRRALAGQSFAHQQGHGLGDRNPLGVGDPQGPHLLQPCQQGRAHIGPHPGQGL